VIEPEWLEEETVPLVAIVSFLDINGQQFIADEPSAKLNIERLAASEIDEAALADWIAANVEPVK
jgi:prophage maintenance system killer protein